MPAVGSTVSLSTELSLQECRRRLGNAIELPYYGIGDEPRGFALGSRFYIRAARRGYPLEETSGWVESIAGKTIVRIARGHRPLERGMLACLALLSLIIVGPIAVESALGREDAFPLSFILSALLAYVVLGVGLAGSAHRRRAKDTPVINAFICVVLDARELPR